MFRTGMILLLLAVAFPADQRPQQPSETSAAAQNDQAQAQAPISERESYPTYYMRKDALSQERSEAAWWGISYEGWIAIFTLALVASTMALAGSTLLLWRATERAVERAEKSATRQSQDMQDSIAAARLTAKNLLRVTRPMLVPVNLRLRAFEGRVPRALKEQPGPYASVFCDFKNTGTAIGFIKAAVFGTSIGTAPARMPTNAPVMLGYHSVGPDCTLAHELPVTHASFPESILAATTSSEETLFVYGWCRYADLHGIVRRGGFCFELYPDVLLAETLQQMQFRPSGPAEYWYDVEESNDEDG